MYIQKTWIKIKDFYTHNQVALLYIKLQLRDFPLLKVPIIFHYWSLFDSDHIWKSF